VTSFSQFGYDFAGFVAIITLPYRHLPRQNGVWCQSLATFGTPEDESFPKIRLNA
jgi:hypothetical protein